MIILNDMARAIRVYAFFEIKGTGFIIAIKVTLFDWLFYALVDKVIVNKYKIVVKWKDGTES